MRTSPETCNIRIEILKIYLQIRELLNVANFEEKGVNQFGT